MSGGDAVSSGTDARPRARDASAPVVPGTVQADGSPPPRGERLPPVEDLIHPRGGGRGSREGPPFPHENDARFHVMDASPRENDVRFHAMDASPHENDARFHVMNASPRDKDARLHVMDASLGGNDAWLHGKDASLGENDVSTARDRRVPPRQRRPVPRQGSVPRREPGLRCRGRGRGRGSGRSGALALPCRGTRVTSKAGPGGGARPTCRAAPRRRPTTPHRRRRSVHRR